MDYTILNEGDDDVAAAPAPDEASTDETSTDNGLGSDDTASAPSEDSSEDKSEESSGNDSGM